MVYIEYGGTRYSVLGTQVQKNLGVCTVSTPCLAYRISIVGSPKSSRNVS